MKPYVDILGTRYKIEVHKISEDSYLSDNRFDGYCSEFNKMIVIADVDEEKYFKCSCEAEKEQIIKTILRHEICHAFMNESGLSTNALVYGESWAKNEEMIDWMAIQIPKIVEAFKWCECL